MEQTTTTVRDFGMPASIESLERAVAALTANGFVVHVVESEAEALAKFKELVPQGAEIMNNASVTADTVGVSKEIMESGNYTPVRKLLMDKEADPREKKRHGSAPEWSVGSVHAVTEGGSVMIASASGSQLPGYAYGADHVVWFVGTQKIVKDIPEGITRIKDHAFPLENARAQKAYGQGSSISEILIINKQPAERSTIVLIKETIGY